MRGFKGADCSLVLITKIGLQGLVRSMAPALNLWLQHAWPLYSKHLLLVLAMSAVALCHCTASLEPVCTETCYLSVSCSGSSTEVQQVAAWVPSSNILIGPQGAGRE